MCANTQKYLYIAECLEKKPINAKELKSGKALRVVRCVRAGNGEALAWSVVCLSRRKIEDDSVGLTDAFRMLVKKETVRRLSHPEVVDLFDTQWFSEEFEIVLPLWLRIFTLQCGSALFHVSWSFRNFLLDRHYCEIRNAGADDKYPLWFEHKRGERVASVVSEEDVLFSVVTPAFHTPPVFLSELIESVKSQSYTNWELIIVNASPSDKEMHAILSSVDDSRIKVVDHPENEGIALNTNRGIECSRGDYVGFLDHDDLLDPNALQRYANAIEESNREADLLYCDEDSIDENGEHCMPLFKPPFNIDLLYSNNYAIHWLVVSRRILDNVQRSGKDVDGAQDYDLTLRACEHARKVVHIPEVLYHWRIHSGSTNSNPDSKPYAQIAGCKALEYHFARRHLSARVSREPIACTYRTEFFYGNNQPSVSCVACGVQKTTELEIALEEYQEKHGIECEFISQKEISLHSLNEALCEVENDIVLFLSADVVEITELDIARMVGYFQRPEVVAVGPHWRRRDDLIDSSGICVSPDGDLIYMNRYLLSDDGGYLGRSKRPYDATVLDSRCIMVRKSDLLLAGGFDEGFQTFAYAFADVCVRVRKLNLLCVCTPFIELSESCLSSLLEPCAASDAVEDRCRFIGKYSTLFAEGDPSHNQNFNPYSPYYRLKWY